MMPHVLALSLTMEMQLSIMNVSESEDIKMRQLPTITYVALNM